MIQKGEICERLSGRKEICVAILNQTNELTPVENE